MRERERKLSLFLPVKRNCCFCAVLRPFSAVWCCASLCCASLCVCVLCWCLKRVFLSLFVLVSFSLGCLFSFFFFVGWFCVREFDTVSLTEGYKHRREKAKKRHPKTDSVVFLCVSRTVPFSMNVAPQIEATRTKKNRKENFVNAFFCLFPFYILLLFIFV